MTTEHCGLEVGCPPRSTPAPQIPSSSGHPGIVPGIQTLAILPGQEGGEVQVGWGAEGGPGQGGQRRGGLLKKGKLGWMART